MNIYSDRKRQAHECEMNCPKYVPGTFPEHGEVLQCSHGRWFAAKVERRPSGGLMAQWRPIHSWRVKAGWWLK